MPTNSEIIPIKGSDVDQDYFSGKKLIGDSFDYDAIRQWYEDEKEAYADLGSKNKDNYSYGYHYLNAVNGFNYLPKGTIYEHVLGFGSAYGHELKAIATQMKKVTIVDPSDHLISEEIFGIKPSYIKPSILGDLPFEDNSFDLITCFGTLHHIPNVSHVFNELARVLKPGGFLLIREPITSMGDWNKKRPGLTSHERGIPLKIFRNLIQQNKKIQLVKENPCFSMTSFLQSTLGKFFKQPLYSYKFYIVLDHWFSKMMSWNVTYHATHFFNRISPSNVFYILKK